VEGKSIERGFVVVVVLKLKRKWQVVSNASKRLSKGRHET
jgi:hypothetical protein